MNATTTQTRRTRSPIERVGLQQALLGVAILAIWEMGGHGGAERWISRPALIGARLQEWLSNGDLLRHLTVTLSEVFIGLAIGTVLGSLAGLILGRLPLAGSLFRPIIVALYSVPLVALAPLFIMFFGLGLLPKIVLVSLVVFFLLFFNTFAGAQAVDRDLTSAAAIMGATRRETFMKVVLPASTVWIIGGLRIAVPYALVAAITGELLATRAGLGFLISQAAESFDVTGLYAVLFILMGIGLGLTEAITRYERRALRWHNGLE